MTTPEPAALIYSQGYRRYTGPRTGVAGSMWALATFSLRNMLGIGRRGIFKIAPILIVGYAILVAVVFALIAALASFDNGTVPLGLTITANLGSLGWFAILIAPSTLIADRRDGLYALYLTTPLNRLTYLVSKWAAIVAVLCLVSIVPGLLVLVGFTFADGGPNTVGKWLTALGRLVLSGLVVSVLYALFAMMVAALSRRALFAGIASAVILWVGGGLSAALVLGSDFSPLWGLLSLPTAVEAIVATIFGDPVMIGDSPVTGLSTQWIWLAAAGHLLVPTTVLAVRYSQIGIER